MFPTKHSTGKPILVCTININRAKEQPTHKDTKGSSTQTFLVVQWLRIHLEMQGMWVQALVRELRSHVPQSNRARLPQQKVPLCRNDDLMEPDT